MNDDIEILLVEDNPDDLDLALHALKKHRVANHIQVARDGAEALEFLFGTGPHAQRDTGIQPRFILLDLKLPKVDGIEVLRQIKADPRTKAVPVVVLTSSKEDFDLARCYELGVNSYIVKPMGFQQFAEVVRQMGFYWMLLNQPPRR